MTLNSVKMEAECIQWEWTTDIVHRSHKSHHVNAMTRYLLFNDLCQQFMVPDFAKTILHVDTASGFRGLKMKIQLKL